MSWFFSDREPTSTVSESASAPRRRHWLLKMMLVLSLAVVLVIAGAAVYLGTLSKSVSSHLERAQEMPAEIPTDPKQAPRPAKAATAGKAINYVILGSDSRTADAGQGRSDVLMVLHLDGDRKGASLISFPRDLYVDVPGHGNNKINAAFSFGGTPLAIRTLEGLLKTRMDHAALIDFEGFIELTDQLGGVTVDNPHPSVSGGYDFPVGKIKVQGAQALAYVRERKQLPRGDLDRAERQRLVVQAVLRKGLSKDTLLNPIAFNRFISAAAGTVTVDDDLTSSELRKTALSLRFKPDDIASIQAPILGFAKTSDGQSIDVVDRDKMAEMVKALRTDGMADYLARYPEG